MNEEEVLLGKIKTQFEEQLKGKGFTTQKEIDAAVAEKMKAFEGLDVAKLKTWLEDGDKGIMSILKKQGEELEEMKKKSSAKVKVNLENLISEKMADIEKLFKKGEGQMVINLGDVAKKVAVTMTTDNTVDGYDELPSDVIDSFSIGAFVPKRYPREYVFDLADRTTVAKVEKYKVWEEEGDQEGAFAVVSEGAVKPLVSGQIVKNSSTARKVAGKYVVTEEFQKFKRNAYNIITRLIRQKMTRDYASILETDLSSFAVNYTGSALDGQFADPTDFHAIGAVAAQIEALNFKADMLTLNPQDKWRIGLSQNGEGTFYMNIPVYDPSGNIRMMGFIVRTSNKLDPGTFILGESGLWNIEEEAISIRMGYGINVTKTGDNVTDVSSDFDNNRFRVILETWFHSYLATNNEGSFVIAEFDEVKEALASSES